MNLTPVPWENITADEKRLHRFAKIHAYSKLAIVGFGGAALALAAVVTGHLNLPGSGVVATATLLGFFSGRRAAALLREDDGDAAPPVVQTPLREARSLG